MPFMPAMFSLCSSMSALYHTVDIASSCLTEEVSELRNGRMGMCYSSLNTDPLHRMALLNQVDES